MRNLAGGKEKRGAVEFVLWRTTGDELRLGFDLGCASVKSLFDCVNDQSNADAPNHAVDVEQ